MCCHGRFRVGYLDCILVYNRSTRATTREWLKYWRGHVVWRCILIDMFVVLVFLWTINARKIHLRTLFYNSGLFDLLIQKQDDMLVILLFLWTMNAKKTHLRKPLYHLDILICLFRSSYILLRVMGLRMYVIHNVVNFVYIVGEFEYLQL
ncbi:hypothetical protein O6H91_12G035000 [Diphasiastrum complanatum]|uniref:Uncharacterized protein n=1 Tax=Diphasiastrum complanatum TaxID=34168 RepID=A0ACC2C0H4_DIPCM|nr:hypothetical protein O6H91_12G035000 [Diphasiastrum complanatum]